jgi:hypothetical protein
MKKHIKKLFLSRETLRNLSPRDLRVIDGGATYYFTGRPGCTTTAADCGTSGCPSDGDMCPTTTALNCPG